ncbi:MAG: glycosyltransferase family 1 protein [Chloroflexota bacterium]|nr:MAG: glycosyltransferase family 1 protein [Chloroflexota bacterium]
MRIAFLDWVLDPAKPGRSGLSDITWELAQNFVALGHDVHVIGAYDDAPAPEIGATLHRVHRPALWRRNVIGQCATCAALALRLRRIPRPDVVMAPEYIAAAAATLIHPDIPVAFTTTGNIFERIANGNPFDWSTTQTYKVAALVAARRCARVIAISHHMASWWQRIGTTADRIAVIPLGVDPSQYRPVERATARHTLGIPDDEETILFVGRFSPEKNVQVAIRAVASLASRRPRLRLRLVGGGPREAELRALARDLGAEQSVIFVGWAERSTVPTHYGASDAVVLPSTSEPFARVPIEAMAAGALVIGSRAGGTPDAIANGVTGLLADPRDTEQWIVAIERVLDRPAERAAMIAAARLSVEERFTWPVVSRRIVDEVLEPMVRSARSNETPRQIDAPRKTDPRVYFIDYILDLDRPGASGLSDIVWDIAEELTRQGGEAHVIAPYRVNPRPRSGVTLHTFALPPIGYRNILGHILIAVAACRLLPRDGSAYLVHAPEYLSTAVATFATTAPVILTVPGSIDEKIASGANPYDWSVTAALWCAARVSAWRCARVLATTREMMRWWRKTGVAEDRLALVPLGVDEHVYHRRANARTRLGIAAGARVVLAVGRLNAENEFATIVDAFAAATATEFPDARLHIVGAGPEESRLRANAAAVGVADRVIWRGWVAREQLPDYYSAADAFAFGASTGGLPRVVIEAMACGAPVVATAISGVTDHITDRDTGYLVPPRDPAALAERLRTLLRDPVESRALGARAARHVHGTLGWPSIVRRLIDDVYQPVLARHARQ